MRHQVDKVNFNKSYFLPPPKFLKYIAAVSFIADVPWFGGVGLGSGTTGKAHRAWVGAVQGMVHGYMVVVMR